MPYFFITNTMCQEFIITRITRIHVEDQVTPNNKITKHL